jgi:NAD-dependent SIR2 family protein deacetylase
MTKPSADRDYCHTCHKWVIGKPKDKHEETLPACPKCKKVLFEAAARLLRRKRDEMNGCPALPKKRK